MLTQPAEQRGLLNFISAISFGSLECNHSPWINLVLTHTSLFTLPHCLSIYPIQVICAIMILFGKKKKTIPQKRKETKLASNPSRNGKLTAGRLRSPLLTPYKSIYWSTLRLFATWNNNSHA